MEDRHQTCRTETRSTGKIKQKSVTEPGMAEFEKNTIHSDLFRKIEKESWKNNASNNNQQKRIRKMKRGQGEVRKDSWNHEGKGQAGRDWQ